MASTPSWPTLKYGQSGPNVSALQCLINARMSKITVTGTFDQATRQSVATFQRQNNLVVTEQADEAVLSRMIASVRQTEEANPKASYMPEAAQFLINKFESVSVDGIFGPGSATALATFQLRMGIPIAGVVNTQTWQYLFGYNTYPGGGGVPLPSTVAYASICSVNSRLTTAQMEKNAKHVYDFLIKSGFSKNAACGVLGNMQRESGIDPGVWEIMANTSKGYGLVQWTPATKFLNWAVNNSVLSAANTITVNALAASDPVKLIKAEEDCLIWSCTTGNEFLNPSATGYANHTGLQFTFSTFKTSRETPETLAVAFNDYFERSDNGNNDSSTNTNTENLNQRKTFARNWFNKF